MNANEITIDEEFSKLFDSLTEEEYAELESSCLKKGIEDPLKVWKVPNGKLILYDGHNRLRIAQEHNLDFKVVENDFPNRDAVKSEMYSIQLGRRNLNDAQRTYYLGKRYDAEKASHGASDGFRGNRFTGSVVSRQNDDLPKGRTVAKIAREHGVGTKTVERAEKFAKALDSATEIDPLFKNDVLSGKVKATKKEIMEIGTVEEAEKKKEMVQELRKPKSERAINVHKLSDALEGIRQNAENVFDEQFKNMFAHGDESRRCEVCKRILPLDMFSDDTHLFRCRQCATQLKRDSEGSKTMPETLDPNIPTTITGEDVINEFRLIVDRFLWSLKNALEINKPNREEWTDHKIILEINACINKMNEIKKEIKNETRRESI